MDGELVARTYHDLDDTAQPADRTAAPARGDKVALLSAERLDPALVDAALGGEVGENRGQQRLEVVHGRLREGDDPEPVTQRRRQRIQRIRRGDIAHLAEIERDLHGRIRITGRGLGLEEAEQTVPEPAIVGSRAGLFEFVDHDDRVGLLEARDRQERMAGLGRVPALVGAAEHGAVAAAHLYMPAPDGGRGYLPDRQELPDQRRDDREILRLPHQDEARRDGDQRAPAEIAQEAGPAGPRRGIIRLILWKFVGSWPNGPQTL